MTGRWVRVEGRNRCQECGRFVQVAWLYFPDAKARWTHCYCDDCAGVLAGAK